MNEEKLVNEIMRLRRMLNCIAYEADSAGDGIACRMAVNTRDESLNLFPEIPPEILSVKAQTVYKDDKFYNVDDMTEWVKPEVVSTELNINRILIG